MDAAVAQHAQRAQQLLYAGQFAAAAEAARKALEKAPGDAALMRLRAAALMRCGGGEEAHRLLTKAVALAPHRADFFVDLSQACRTLYRLEESHAAIDRAIELNPDDPAALTVKASLQQLEGDRDGALKTLEPLAKSGCEHHAFIIQYAQLCSSAGRDREVVGLLENLLERGNVPPAARAQALFALGQALENLGEYDWAFEAYQGGNALKGQQFDADAHSRAIDRVIESWSPETVEALPRASADAGRCLFIVGMPRSGTSLVEQILASHPDVHGAGELGDVPGFVAQVQGVEPGGVPMVRDTSLLNRARLNRFARGYLRRLEKISGGAARVTDKGSLNFLYLGLIAIALPGARVIHCVRNPLDTCVSNYTREFGGFTAFTNDLDTLGRFYRDYERLMEHWKAVLDVPVLEIVYEDLVADQLGRSRRLVEFAGLEWHEACERFYETERVTWTSSMEQVRKPMYDASVGRHERFAAHLGPLRDALGAGR